jgi:two-component system OmpR family sensor kinase
MRMTKPQSFRLLSKTTFIYLIFTFIAFLISAVYLTREADEYIQNEMEHRYNRAEHRIKRHIKRGSRPLEQLLPNYIVTLLSDTLASNNYPVYSDTVMYDAETDETHYMGKKIVILELEGKYYKAVIHSEMDDLINLKDDIFGALIPAFILLAISIVAFNYILSGYLFRPFNKILGIMKIYTVGQRNAIEKVDTSTIEFKNMQELFHQMVDRIESDYQNLKEYTEHMAHEIQTPLSVVRNKIDSLISDNNVMKSHKDTVKIIYDEVSHLSKLGSGLNLLTKINNREFTNVEKIFTKSVIEKHVGSVEDMASLKSLSIKTSLSEKHSLYIDPFLLDILLKNLLRNAISYATIDGPIHIETNDNSMMISNYGPSLDIPAEKIFERFYSNHQKKSSLGLGLSLVKKICELNQLKINYKFENRQHIFTIDNI